MCVEQAALKPLLSTSMHAYVPPPPKEEEEAEEKAEEATAEEATAEEATAEEGTAAPMEGEAGEEQKAGEEDITTTTTTTTAVKVETAEKVCEGDQEAPVAADEPSAMAVDEAVAPAEPPTAKAEAPAV